MQRNKRLLSCCWIGQSVAKSIERVIHESSRADKQSIIAENERHQLVCQYRRVTLLAAGTDAKHHREKHVWNIIWPEERNRWSTYSYVRAPIRWFRDDFLSLHVRDTRTFVARFHNQWH